jgi:hypothetical protein
MNSDPFDRMPNGNNLCAVERKIFGIVGAIGSGKDTIGDYLICTHNFKRIAFAGKVKDVAALVFGWDRDMLEGATKESRAWREEVCPYWKITPRSALQKIGTEMFRAHIDDAIWIKSVSKEVSKSEQNIVITDCRFENEIQAIRDLGGRIIYVERGVRPDWASSPDKMTEEERHYLAIHITDWNVYKFGESADYKIMNNGTLEDLYNSMKKIIVRNE